MGTGLSWPTAPTWPPTLSCSSCIKEFKTSKSAYKHSPLKNHWWARFHSVWVDFPFSRPGRTQKPSTPESRQRCCKAWWEVTQSFDHEKLLQVSLASVLPSSGGY